MKSKICGTCKRNKPITEFWKCSTSKDGYQYNCKPCKLKYNREYRQRNPQKSKLWDKKCKEKYKKEDLVEYKKRCRNSQLKTQYGIDIAEYKRLFSKQFGCCCICGIHQSQLKKALAVDHDHKTGKVRGLLCPICNRSIGWYEKNKIKADKYFLIAKELAKGKNGKE